MPAELAGRLTFYHLVECDGWQFSVFVVHASLCTDASKISTGTTAIAISYPHPVGIVCVGRAQIRAVGAVCEHNGFRAHVVGQPSGGSSRCDVTCRRGMVSLYGNLQRDKTLLLAGGSLRSQICIPSRQDLPLRGWLSCKRYKPAPNFGNFGCDELLGTLISPSCED